MTDETLRSLVEDAQRVADVGVRLGRIKDAGFLTALSKARQAMAGDAVSPDVVTALQKSLNSAVKDLSPITLDDLRSGWRPFKAPSKYPVGTLIFGVFSFLLLVATAYTTQIYDRASSLYATTLELQEVRGAEQAVRLLGLLRKNQKDVVESLTSGNKDFLYEAFNKALFDLQMTNARYLVYAERSVGVLRDLDGVLKLLNLLQFPLSSLTRGSPEQAANPTNDPTIAKWIQGYGTASPDAVIQPPDAVIKPLAPQTKQALTKQLTRSADRFNGQDIPSLLNIYIGDIRSFLSAIQVGIDPLQPNSYSGHLYRLQEGMSFLGVWVLPLLYGMLGAVLFHMRRLLDPTVPDPSWLRFAYRIVLGGFAGIIFVWFWTPSSPKLSQPAFATLTSFGLAFLVGFSTDVFFQALDRLVDYLPKATGQTAV